MKQELILLLLFLSLASLSEPNGAQSPKPPWRWSLDERLAVINDPVAAAERLRAAQRSRIAPLAKTEQIANPLPSDQVDFISGKDHPELLLPWELFDNMMTMAYADDPEVRSIFRAAKSSSLARSHLPVDFWERLEPLSLAYLSDGRQIRDLHKKGVNDAAVKRRVAAQTHALENLRCRDRAAAIAAARNDFGEKFDQFLYTAIAPNMSITVARLGRISQTREHQIEAGCQ